MKTLLRIIISPLWLTINLVYAIRVAINLTCQFIRNGGQIQTNTKSEADTVREEMAEKLASVILENYRLQEELKKYQSV